MFFGFSPCARGTEAGVCIAGIWCPGLASDFVVPWGTLELEHPSGVSGAGQLAALSCQLWIWKPREPSPWMTSCSEADIILTSEEVVSQ